MSESPAPGKGSTTLAPVSPEERIAVLDVLRGVALLGILIMNLPGFNTPGSAGVLRPRLFPGMVDRAAEFVMLWLVAGKANAIFSFLFGLGMTIQMQRAATGGGRLVPVYLRRLAVLFAIGATHGLLLWNGDVLHVYAVLGLVLLALRRASDRVVLAIVALCVVAPVVRSGWALYVQEAPLHPLPYWVDLAHQHMHIFQHGSYAEQLGVRVAEYKRSYGMVTTLRGSMWGYVSFTITMLFGFYVGRKRVLENVTANVAWIRKATLWCFAPPGT